MTFEGWREKKKAKTPSSMKFMSHEVLGRGRTCGGVTSMWEEASAPEQMLPEKKEEDDKKEEGGDATPSKEGKKTSLGGDIRDDAAGQREAKCQTTYDLLGDVRALEAIR
eukprot:CAMPEP_0206439458 /NCGR_PEP_ID=MMETSP0324_2-20121206/12214_1 /ASSEMBLY_ACC=CAM_ASM_000836 /TAXON_ID=2866 /ORGANISM="Crypthecodinium cohnii, Strain Seligo" /LENGTH=109 /DNA_ID=CAMNT_0053907065 /DNA_START=132 /DNA_END=461 /DNA_ORIENTATION=-